MPSKNASLKITWVKNYKVYLNIGYHYHIPDIGNDIWKYNLSREHCSNNYSLGEKDQGINARSYRP